MKRAALTIVVFLVGLGLNSEGASRAQTQPMGTAFTYQGYLERTGIPVDDTCDLRFSLWDNLASGTQVGAAQTLWSVEVSNGLFTILLDFGSGAFNGDARWVETGVWCTGDTAFTNLSPRQELTPTPYALRTRGIDGHSLDAADEDPVDALFIDDDGDVGIGTITPSEALDVAGNIHASGLITSGGSITVNGITNTITSTDDLRLYVSSGTALRLEGNPNGPNVIGGYGGNDVSSNVYGGTVGGGGNSGEANYVFDIFGTVGGGARNQAGSDDGSSNAGWATVGGGYANTAGGDFATVGGGNSNFSLGDMATVAGGNDNHATGPNSTVAGGAGNIASGYASTVGGGYNINASGTHSTVGGGQDNHATGVDSTVAGGMGNTASGAEAAIGGGSDNLAVGGAATIPGGRINVVTDNYGTVGGGQDNTAGNGGGVPDDALCATVGGGYSNSACAEYSTVPGGYLNHA